MTPLNFPAYQFKIRSVAKYADKDGKMEIFDAIRRKYVTLTPEEWVRQHTTRYLIEEKKYPKSLIAVETSLVYNRMKRRADIIAYDHKGNPILIAECKAATTRISQRSFDQAARYNFALKVRYLLVTNGIVHYCCWMNYIENTYEFIKELPDYQLN